MEKIQYAFEKATYILYVIKNELQFLFAQISILDWFVFLALCSLVFTISELILAEELDEDFDDSESIED